MKELYTPSYLAIGRYRTVALDKNDKMLSGSKGWVFLANKAGTRIGVVLLLRNGEEKIFYHDFKMLEKWVSAAGFYRATSTKAERYANNPNDRYGRPTKSK